MEAITGAASAFAYSQTLKAALSVLATYVGLYAYLNPYDSCPLNNTYFDYIVVGGGTSGCIVANQLSQNPNTRVLIIEAGPNFDIDSLYASLAVETVQSRIDWNFTSLPDSNYGKCHKDGIYRPVLAKVLGGESSIDFLIYSQGSEQLYNLWYNITNEPSWSYTNVLKLIKRIERLNDTEIRNSPDAAYHGFNGKVGLYKDHSPAIEKYFTAFSQIGKRRVLDLNSRTKYGVTGAIYRISNGFAVNSAMVYLTPVRKRQNLFVLKNAQVTKILFDKKNRAVAVEVAIKDTNTNTFKYSVFRANVEIIVSAGPFNTAKLLQLSGVGPRKLLNSLNIPVKSDLPVGYNGQNHIAVPIIAAITKTRCKLVPENNDPGHYSYPTIVSYSAVNTSDSFYAEYRTVSNIITVTPPTSITIEGTVYARFKDEIIDYYYNRGKGRELMRTLVENTKVASRSEVRIRSTNPFDNPIIDTNYYSNEIDVENMVKYVKDFVRIFDTPYFRGLGAFIIDPTRGICGNYVTGSDDYWRCYVRCLYVPLSDHAGTAAMGSVLDGRLRVKGVSALRVAGAGSMPILNEGSTTIPTMVIGLNAADMILEDNNGKI